MSVSVGPMEVSTDISYLRTGLRIVTRAVSSRTTLPILSHVLLETVPSGLRLTATDLTVTMITTVPADVIGEGKTTVPAKLLTELVGSLPEGPVSLRCTPMGGEREELCVESGIYDTQLYGLSADEFPPGHQVDEGSHLTISAGALLAAVRRTRIALANDEARPTLTGMLLQVQDGKLLLVASDGHRLAECREVLLDDGGIEDLRIIVPGRALSELGTVLREAKDDDPVMLRISSTSNRLSISCLPVQVIAGLIDGTYPRYEQVIPQDEQILVRMNTKEFQRGLRVVSPFATDTANVVRLDIDGSWLHLSAMTAEVGNAHAEIPIITMSQKEMQVAFNARYLLEVLNVLDTEETELVLNGPHRPGLIRPAGEGARYRHVIMPVKLGVVVDDGAA